MFKKLTITIFCIAALVTIGCGNGNQPDNENSQGGSTSKTTCVNSDNCAEGEICYFDLKCYPYDDLGVQEGFTEAECINLNNGYEETYATVYAEYRADGCIAHCLNIDTFFINPNTGANYLLEECTEPNNWSLVHKVLDSDHCETADMVLCNNNNNSSSSDSGSSSGSSESDNGETSGDGDDDVNDDNGNGNSNGNGDGDGNGDSNGNDDDAEEPPATPPKTLLKNSFDILFIDLPLWIDIEVDPPTPLEGSCIEAAYGGSPAMIWEFDNCTASDGNSYTGSMTSDDGNTFNLDFGQFGYCTNAASSDAAFNPDSDCAGTLNGTCDSQTTSCSFVRNETDDGCTCQ